jgi:hypothetical protein
VPLIGNWWLTTLNQNLKYLIRKFKKDCKFVDIRQFWAKYLKSFVTNSIIIAKVNRKWLEGLENNCKFVDISQLI